MVNNSCAKMNVVGRVNQQQTLRFDEKEGSDGFRIPKYKNRPEYIYPDLSV
jgi:hypothetical protein